ncbi:hypothetical protein [Comamonas sp.]|uniref:hypothetical protein n=1 Tax=Comamonas sp. TaxID=34028 RepID=UPI0025904D0E|nr:hypothetical protein [Comamonas sp.]
MADANKLAELLDTRKQQQAGNGWKRAAGSLLAVADTHSMCPDLFIALQQKPLPRQRN